MAEITLNDVRRNPRVRVYIKKADDYLGILGYTEHGFRHTELAARRAKQLLKDLEYSQREAELAAIAGYLHDIGNMVGRDGHDLAGAMISMSILQELGMPPDEVAEVVSAVGNHDEEEGRVVNPVSAALILSDKSDVHRSRVRNRDRATFDIHDRVNYAVNESKLIADRKNMMITLKLNIDTEISHVMEYFEIFLIRMMMCRRAATFLKARFSLVINENRLL